MPSLQQRFRALVEAVGQSVGRAAATVLAPPAGAVRGGRWGIPTLVGLMLLIPVIVLIWSVLLSPVVADGRVLPRLVYANERSMGVEIEDHAGRYLGMIHYRADPKYDYVEPEDLETENQAMLDQIAAYDIRPDHKTIHLMPDEVPEHFWRCLIRLEDRAMGWWWRNPAGIDFWTAFKIPIDGYGGSTVPMMISRHMRKSLPSRAESAQTKAWRKAKEWEEAPTIWRYLGAGTPDKGGLKAWSAQHVVLLTELGGSGADIVPDVYGVQTASRLLFGVTPDELSVAQQFLLAAAYKRPLVPYRPPAPGAEEPAIKYAANVKGRWEKAVKRARLCVDADAHVLNDAERPAAEAALAAIEATPPSIKVDPELLSAWSYLAGERNVTAASRRIEHPYARLRAALPRPHRRMVVDLVTDRFGRNWRDQIRRIELTLDAPADLRFQAKMNAAWLQFEQKNADGWLLTPSTSGAMGYLVVAADDQGNIVRYYEGATTRVDGNSNPIPRQDGGSARYPGEVVGEKVTDTPRACPKGQTGSVTSPCPFAERTRPYQRGGREVASIGKIIASIALAEDGAAPSRSAVNAFAFSNNAQVEAMLTSVETHRLDELLAAFGFIRSDTKTPHRVAVSRGMILGTPREVHRLAAAALAIARGQWDKPVRLPSLIARYDLLDPSRRVHGALASPDKFDRPLDLRALLLREGGPKAEDVSRFVSSTLSAPVCGGGTLSMLSRWCPSGSKRARLHVAKTGTRANDTDRQTVDIWLAGGIEFEDGRAYTYVVMAGTGQPRRPFHTRALNASSAAPVLDALLEDLSSIPKPAETPAAPQTVKQPAQ